MTTPEAALAAARAWWADHDSSVVVDRLVEDDTHFGVCTVPREPDASLMVGGPILFIRKADGALEPGGSAEGLRIGAMRELT